MKIKHYRAPDMRQALRMVREAQGPDAVILSSRRVNGGVEVVAAVDYDHDGVDAYGHDLHAMSAQAHASQPVERTDRAACTMHEDRSIRSQGVTDSASRARDQGLAIDAIDELERSADLSEELRAMRRMLETQLATLAWNDLSRRSPVQAELLKELTQIGLARDLSAELVAQMPAGIQLAEAQRLALALIARRIAVASERWLDSGGVVAMVGATGVGKTTLIAKLAARWLLQHGPRSIALISTDSIRIGAHEQIHTLGRLLGVPAYAIDGASELAELLDHLSDKRLVLIDTAGYSQRDPRLHEELEMLAAANERLETTLVLSAVAQAGAIEEAVERFAAARPATCVLTKLDEATSLGGSISMLIRSGLPVAYLSDGQRVPEDISPARAHQLVARAVELARKSGATADEDLLRRRFGEVAHALA